jgi:tRNA threonylcarbamoyladenosine biosynthesis protein TsaB
VGCIVLILGIDTATTSVSVALSNGRSSRDGGIIGVQTLSVGPRHAETLLPALEFLCRQCSVALADITHIVVDRGPGLFTGLRVGVATARTLAYALDVPLFAATSLEAIALDGGRPGELVASVLDARRRELYAALYRIDSGARLIQVVEPMVGVPFDVVAKIVAGVDGPVHVVGDGVVSHRAEMAALFECVAVTTGRALASTAVGLIEAILGRIEAGPTGEEAEILYLRDPDAQITWDNRHGPAEGKV